MRILLVTATSIEIAPLLARLRYVDDRGQRCKAYSHAGHDVDVLVTGVGVVATAAWTSHVLTECRYDLALNIGVCGSFDRLLPLAGVVHVVSDRLADLGAEDGDAFLTVQELGLLGDAEFPFTAGQLVNRVPPANSALRALPAVHGVTVSTVHGNERSIADVAQRFKPQVESMEGAAFMYACAIHGAAFAQVRAISNVVEKRNRASWKLDDAIASLTDTTLAILDCA